MNDSYHLRIWHIPPGSRRDSWRQDWTRTPTSEPEWFTALPDTFLKEILRTKARVRPNRFFGEAFAASALQPDEAWYSSFKWLTSSMWLSSRPVKDSFQRRFRDDIQRRLPSLAEVQTRAKRFGPHLQPVPPDLWLIKDAQHAFVEVKLAKDRVSETQLAGLAVCATIPRAVVGIAFVQDRPPRPAYSNELRARFDDMRGRLA